MTPTTLAARIAHHFPYLPPTVERADGGVWYALSAYVSLDVSSSPNSYIATLSASDYLGLARFRADGEAATPEAAVAAVIREGDHILAAAALASAQQVHTLAVLLGTNLPTMLSAAQERVDHTLRLATSLRTATKAADDTYIEAREARVRAKTMAAVEAALPGLTGAAHAHRVALLRKLAPSGWHKVNGNRIRWLQGAGLVDAHKVITATDRHNRPTASFTEASITNAGRLALRALDAAKGATP